MDGIHDLGGMHGFGRVVPEPSEPVFHAPWEARMFALAMTVPFADSYSDDHFRTAIEKMEPGHYLRSTYYAKWCEAVVRLLEERGALTGDERAGAIAVRPEAVLPAIFAGASQARPDAVDAARRFRPGDRVRTRTAMGLGHNRLPRYARGRTGIVESVHGAFLAADRNSAGDQTPESLYTVRFTARELWGREAPSGDTLSLDCWDSYLELAA